MHRCKYHIMHNCINNSNMSLSLSLHIMHICMPSQQNQKQPQGMGIPNQLASGLEVGAVLTEVPKAYISCIDTIRLMKGETCPPK